MDLGDTAAFQAEAGSWSLTPRQAYPLYHVIGHLFLGATSLEPARALNLASAVLGALACGVTTWVSATLVASTAAGLFSGLLLGFSYTFWSQAIIAEVYPLHLLMVALSLAAILSWDRHPTTPRLALFLSVYALGFGNHLSAILLLPAFGLFLLFGDRRGPDLVLRPKIILLAVVIALAGSMQYAWNFRGLWLAETPPASVAEALRTFWFDTTKEDWRRSLVLGVHNTSLLSRVAMYWFDIRQQFGVPGVAVAALGASWALRTRFAPALMLALAYLANLLFALTYNVGDTHVFFLPAHLIAAIFAAAGFAALQSRARRLTRAPIAAAAISVLCLGYAVQRGVDTWPAVDRSADVRPTAFLDGMVAGLTSQDSLFGVDMSWQTDNAFDYYVKYRRPDLAWFRADEVLGHFPRLLLDNAAIGRDVLATRTTADRIIAAYPERFRADPDPRSTIEGLRHIAGRLPAGTPYALGCLQPNAGWVVDAGDLAAAVAHLTNGTSRWPEPPQRFQVLVGILGSRPAVAESGDRPYRVSAELGDLRIDARMESWLPADTMRRAGFGHVIVNGRHVLTLERGISFVALDGQGHPILTAYRAGLLAPQARYLIRPAS